MLQRIALCLLILVPNAFGSTVAQEAKLGKAQLGQILAPIALYPDELLASVLVAATYPLEIVQAARWRAEPENAKLGGEELAKALEAKDWDPSVKSLVQVPDLLKKMSDDLEWTETLGNAFLAQEAEMMDEIQYLRRKAEEAGKLSSNRHQRVSKEGHDIIIEPSEAGVVYTPIYDTSEVYGAWAYQDYPPYDWTWAGAPLADGVYWGTGAVIAGAIWAWGDVDWRRHEIDIDVDKWNRINVDRPKISNPKWEHDPLHRGTVPYKGDVVRNRFKGDEAAPGQVQDRSRTPDRRNVESKLKEGALRQPDNARDRSSKGAPKAKSAGQKPAKANAKSAGKKAVARSSDAPKKSANVAKPKKDAARARSAQRPAAAQRSPSVNRPTASGGRGMGRGGGGGGRRGGRR